MKPREYGVHLSQQNVTCGELWVHCPTPQASNPLCPRYHYARLVSCAMCMHSTLEPAPAGTSPRVLGELHGNFRSCHHTDLQLTPLCHDSDFHPLDTLFNTFFQSGGPFSPGTPLHSQLRHQHTVPYNDALSTVLGNCRLGRQSPAKHDLKGAHLGTGSETGVPRVWCAHKMW